MMGIALALAATGAAECGPLEKNLELLKARAAAKAKPAPRAARPSPPRTARARPRRAPRAPQFVSYKTKRFGTKPRGGDLRVSTLGMKGTTHVYVRTRLLSNGGDGQARVPDLAPGKLPVMVWSPDSGKRRTYWVTIRPGRVAELEASL